MLSKWNMLQYMLSICAVNGTYVPFTEHLPYSKLATFKQCNPKVSSPVYLQRLLLAFDAYVNCSDEADCFGSQLHLSSLDYSQTMALRLALSHELALIQGPPGTGKTFIGVKLVEMLLRNRSMWQTNSQFLHQPIVILCYTNHALDQFLENILEKLNRCKIVRVGSRSKSEALKDFSLNQKLKEMHRMQSPAMKMRHNYLKQNYPQTRAKYDALQELCESLDYCPVNEDLYFSFLHPDELKEPAFKSLHDVQDDLYELNEVLAWFEIKCKDMKNSNDLSEDEAYHENSSKGSAVLDMAKNGRKDLRDFFRYLQTRQPQKHRLSAEYRKLTYRQKVELFKYCLELRFADLKREMAYLQEKKNDADKDEDNLKVEILKKADIVGFTTSGASLNNRVLTKLRCKIVIIEEAAEILESHIIAALTNHTQHLVMIGDHKQLRPKAHDYTIGRKHGLEISLFERLINNNFPFATLKNQHRMRPEISKLIHPHIYPELDDDPSVEEYPSIEGITQNIFFISHHENEEEMEDLRSPSNPHEASFIALMCCYLLQQGYSANEITILTPYIGQVVCLKHQLSLYHIDIKGIRIATIDHYQGEENEIILLSLVRSSKPGFVKDDNRVCVALSRAKKGFYCIGNFDMFARHSQLWRNIIESLKNENAIGSHLPLICKSHKNVKYVSSQAEFSIFIKNGCSELCSARLDCGHICPKKCHPYDIDLGHPQNCNKPCARKCKAGIHQCKLRCNEVCQCKELVDKFLPNCGHIQTVYCDKDPELQTCKVPCERFLDCGHPCKARCGESCEKHCHYLISENLPCGHHAQRECSQNVFDRMKTCEGQCKKELDCGHMCTGTCGKCNQGRLHIPCKQPCGRVLICGHICPTNCSQVCPPCKKECSVSCSHGKCGHVCGKPCIPCAEPCEWSCDHYKCNKPCGEICDRPQYNKPCEKKLSCGHQCIGMCNESCPKVCKECNPDHEDFQVFFGTEEDDDARFIQLEDCGHLIEYTALDRYMENKYDEAICFKKCPKCSTRICRSPFRYCNSIKELKRDMNSIKKELNSGLSYDERARMRKEILQMNTINPYFRREFNEQLLYSCNDEILRKYHVSLSALSIQTIGADRAMDELNREEMQFIVKHSRQESMCLKNEYQIVKKQLLSLHTFVKSNQCKSLPHLPLQVFNDIQRERRRLIILLRCYELQANIIRQQIALSENEKEDMTFLRTTLNSFKPQECFLIKDENTLDEFLQGLKQLQRKHGIGGLSKEDMRMVVKAMNAKKGSWYKCPKGHFYNIGDCGGATQVGQCPECGSAIGGSNHRLLDSNSHANIDGSQHAAWSEGANMANYDLNNFH